MTDRMSDDEITGIEKDFPVSTPHQNTGRIRPLLSALKAERAEVERQRGIVKRVESAVAEWEKTVDRLVSMGANDISIADLDWCMRDMKTALKGDGDD